METIYQFCSMWQNLVTNPEIVKDWTEQDIENIIEWSRCAESVGPVVSLVLSKLTISFCFN